jgi:hypothetical protein
VEIAVSDDPIGARTCVCRDCQKFSGGTGTTNAFFMADAIAHEGELSWYESTADSGNTTWRAFCPKCGSHVFTRNSAASHLCGVRVSMFDDRDAIAPQAVIWTDSAPEWAVLDARLPQFPKAPPPA